MCGDGDQKNIVHTRAGGAQTMGEGKIKLIYKKLGTRVFFLHVLYKQSRGTFSGNFIDSHKGMVELDDTRNTGTII